MNHAKILLVKNVQDAFAEKPDYKQFAKNCDASVYNSLQPRQKRRAPVRDAIDGRVNCARILKVMQGSRDDSGAKPDMFLSCYQAMAPHAVSA